MNPKTELEKLVGFYGPTTETESRMRYAFISTAADIINNSGSTGETNHLFGIEVEVPLVDRDFQLVAQTIRDEIMQSLGIIGNVELASHQLELVPDELWRMKTDLLKMKGSVERLFGQRLSPLLRKHGAQVVMMGAYPFAVDTIPYTSGDNKYQKYEIVPSWHKENLTTPINQPTIILNPYVLGLMNSVQITVDSCSPDDAIEKLNRSLLISPILTAIAANAPILNLYRTGWMDIRFNAWQLSHDTRLDYELEAGKSTRIGMPRGYYRDLVDYFARLLRHPFILNTEKDSEHAFEIGNGLNWKDARLKFFPEQGKIGIEFRPIALQPSTEEIAAILTFYLARLTWSQQNQEAYLPIAALIWNKNSAMKYGLSGEMYTITNNGLERVRTLDIFIQDTKRVNQVLIQWGHSVAEVENLLSCIYQRQVKKSPAEQLLSRLGNPTDIGNSRHKRYNKDSLIEAIDLYQISIPKEPENE